MTVADFGQLLGVSWNTDKLAAPAINAYLKCPIEHPTLPVSRHHCLDDSGTQVLVNWKGHVGELRGVKDVVGLVQQLLNRESPRGSTKCGTARYQLLSRNMSFDAGNTSIFHSHDRLHEQWTPYYSFLASPSSGLSAFFDKTSGAWRRRGKPTWYTEHLKDLPIKEKTEISWFFPSQDGAVDKERCILHT